MTALAADCSSCVALCCMAFAFDTGDAFPIDKPAGSPCPKLSGHMCSVHAERGRLGFHGCIGFDCLGAGQRVTQEVFPGQDWRDSPELIVPMIDAFRAMRAVHQTLELVLLAERLPLSPDEAGERAALLALLEPPEGWDAAALAGFEGGPTEARARAFLASLRGKAGQLRGAGRA